MSPRVNRALGCVVILAYNIHPSANSSLSVKTAKLIHKALKTLGFVVLGLLLLVAGTLVALYSPWLQNALKDKLVDRLNAHQGMTMTLDSFRLSFPLDIELGGLSLAQNGDTLVAARQAEASVALLPLLRGEAEINGLKLEDARYRMGAPDSTMFMTIAARGISLEPVKVGLSDMSIKLEKGMLDGAKVSMVISPDTVSIPPSPAEPTNMSIAIGELDLKDLSYTMRLLPTIDSLGATIPEGKLIDGLIDLASQRVALGSMTGNGLGAAFIAPDSATIAATPVVESSDSVSSAPWTIEIDSLSFDNSHALYTTRGLAPVPGLDFGYIEVDSLSLSVKQFFNQATTLSLPLRLHGTERCGVTLDASGTFALDSVAMHLNDFKISTATTALDVTAEMGMGNMVSDASLPLRLDATGGVGVADLRKMFPAFMPYLITLPADDRIDINVFADGTPARLDIRQFDMMVNGCVSIGAKGYVGNFFDVDNMTGDIALSGNVINLNRIKNSMLPKDEAMSINIPRMRLNGHVAMASGAVNGWMKVVTGGGSLALDGRWNSRGESYKGTLGVKDFPIETFMPNLGVGDVTARLDVSGKGYNPFGTAMTAEAALKVAAAEYDHYTYRDIDLNASLENGKAKVSLGSVNPDTRLDLMAEGNLNGDRYDWTLSASGEDIDLYALKFSEVESKLSFKLTGDASITPAANQIRGRLTLDNLDFSQPARDISLSNILARLDTSDSTTVASVHNRDMTLTFTSPASLDSLMVRFSAASQAIDRQMAEKVADITGLQDALPEFALDLVAGSNNALNDVLATSKMSFRKLRLSASNDSILRFDSRLLSFATGSTRLDTISFNAVQHGKVLDFNAGVNNRPGTFDDWAHVSLRGSLADNELDARLRQSNIKNVEGFDIGMKAVIADSVATLRLTPLNQTIGYKPWTVNADNFISYIIPSQHIDANLVMTGGRSRLEVLTEHVEGSAGQEDLVVRLSDIHIADWVSINPFAPPMKGDLNADVRLRRVDGNLNGVGNVGIDNFYYGKERVATMNVDFDVTTKPGGMLYATSDVYVDGRKTMTLAGNLNDSTSTSPYNLDFSMIHFPLETVNPFLPPRMARIGGTLNGTMRISGDAGAPVFNGYMDFDSTAVRLYMTGTDYTFSDEKIPVVDNIVTFERFAIKGVNDNPLEINGKVDIASLSSPKIDLTAKADNMQLVNTRKATKGADVYGKAFISLDSRIHGDMSLMFVNADLRIVPPTNVTYVIPDAANVISSQSAGDMVKFVNFSDTAAVMIADSIVNNDMAMILDATLTIENGTTIGVDLSSDGKNRAQIEADGTLNYTMSPVSDGRMTGRLNINQGYVRYSPPFMSEKNFAFDGNSYVAFNGDVLNPTLSIHAVDVIKANVTQSGQNSRLVNFDVALNVSGTLDRMDVAFDLSTDDDVTVANELQSMSPDQRANQAMNMLLYGMYTGPGTKGDASISGNALYSFLESQINSWAANNIKGVDLSFGIDQYNRTVDGASSQTTSYSYQVSKSLFNDRFKIVVGGNYSTDANADENFSQNLINDISFEYFLNRGHTMYVKIFRHTGYESILEGEITQTGVGFVYRHKLNSLADMFKFLKPKRNKK